MRICSSEQVRFLRNKRTISRNRRYNYMPPGIQPKAHIVKKRIQFHANVQLFIHTHSSLNFNEPPI